MGETQMKEQTRRKVLYLNSRFFRNFLWDDGFQRILTELPRDLEVCSVHNVPERDAIALVLSSKEFDPVEECAMLPELFVKLERREIAVGKKLEEI
jgi:hypothetical protein